MPQPKPGSAAWAELHAAELDTECRAEGARAERLGLNAESNPYANGIARKSWYEGYVESRDKRWQEAGLTNE